MDDPALWHRIQFAFTITYHYLFPQLTMGLAWFLVFWKWRALRTGDERYAARTLAVCRTLAADRDDMVVKAMSWALRVLSDRDRPAVEAFMAEQKEGPP